jgi:hypothetical protein
MYQILSEGVRSLLHPEHECSWSGFCKPSESSDRYVKWLVLQTLLPMADVSPKDEFALGEPLADIQHRDSS